MRNLRQVATGHRFGLRDGRRLLAHRRGGADADRDGHREGADADGEERNRAAHQQHPRMHRVHRFGIGGRIVVLLGNQIAERRHRHL